MNVSLFIVFKVIFIKIITVNNNEQHEITIQCSVKRGAQAGCWAELIGDKYSETCAVHAGVIGDSVINSK